MVCLIHDIIRQKNPGQTDFQNKILHRSYLFVITFWLLSRNNETINCVRIAIGIGLASYC